MFVSNVKALSVTCMSESVSGCLLCLVSLLLLPENNDSVGTSQVTGDYR
jgi:hypothetical protein